MDEGGLARLILNIGVCPVVQQILHHLGLADALLVHVFGDTCHHESRFAFVVAFVDISTPFQEESGQPEPPQPHGLYKETTVAAVEMALEQPLIIAQSFLFLFLAPLFGLNDDSVVDSKH